MPELMSTSEEVKVEPQFEEGSEDDFQIVQLEEGQTAEDVAPASVEVKPEGVTLTKEQYDELVRGKDSTGLLSNSFKELADRLTPRGPANTMQPIPELDPQALEDEAYKPGQFAKVVSQISQQAVAKANAANVPLLQMQSKQLLKLDPNTGEYFKKYEKEIEQRKAALPPQYQANPNVYQWVYDEVMKEKQSEIIEDKAKAYALELIKQQAPATAPKAQQGMFTEGTRNIAAASAPKKTQLVLTTRQRDDMLESGMDPRDVDQVRSYLNDWKARGRK